MLLRCSEKSVINRLSSFKLNSPKAFPQKSWFKVLGTKIKFINKESNYQLGNFSDVIRYYNNLVSVSKIQRVSKKQQNKGTGKTSKALMNT